MIITPGLYPLPDLMHVAFTGREKSVTILKNMLW